MIAHLGMYDRAETAAANDRFWQAIRTHLGYGPDALTRGADFAHVWASPDLLLSQTCGLPYRARLHGHVALVGTPDYALQDCPAGYYRSAIVVRADDPATTLADMMPQRLAYNEGGSQSGWAALWNQTQTLGLTLGPARTASGGHRASAQAVADGTADFASLDALTWTMIQRYDAFAARLRVLDWTTPTPTLPYITAATRDPAPLARAIADAIHDLSRDDRETLHLNGLVQIQPADYRAIPIPPNP